MNQIEELRELVERSMREHDIPYYRKQALIWGTATAAGFLVTQWLYNHALAGRIRGYEILIFWLFLVAATYGASRKAASLPEVESYFSKLYSDFWKAAYYTIAVAVAVAFLVEPRYTGAIIALIVGLMVAIAGIMFKSSYSIAAGVAYSTASVAMVYFWQYQFLLFALLQGVTLVFPNLSARDKSGNP